MLLRCLVLCMSLVLVCAFCVSGLKSFWLRLCLPCRFAYLVLLFKFLFLCLCWILVCVFWIRFGEFCNLFLIFCCCLCVLCHAVLIILIVV